MTRPFHPRNVAVAEAMFMRLAEAEGSHVPTADVRRAVRTATGYPESEVVTRIYVAARYLKDLGFNLTAQDGDATQSGWRLTPDPIETAAYDARTTRRHYSEIIRRYHSLRGGLKVHGSHDPILTGERSFLASLAIQQGLRLGKSSDEVMDELRRERNGHG